jgi:ABC-type branched-subunit amino acid transport system permease subunit
MLWHSPDWGSYLRILVLGLLTMLAMLIVLTAHFGEIVRALRGWPI